MLDPLNNRALPRANEAALNLHDRRPLAVRTALAVGACAGNLAGAFTFRTNSR